MEKSIQYTHGRGLVPLKLYMSYQEDKGAWRLLSERENVNQYWKEHFKVLGGNYFISGSVFNSIPQLPISGNVKIPPTLYEVRKAIKQMKNNKASGAGGIPAEIFKSVEGNAHYGSSLSSRSLRMMKKFQMTFAMLQLWPFQDKETEIIGKRALTLFPLRKLLAEGLSLLCHFLKSKIDARHVYNLISATWQEHFFRLFGNCFDTKRCKQSKTSMCSYHIVIDSNDLIFICIWSLLEIY